MSREEFVYLYQVAKYVGQRQIINIDFLAELP